jgi:hypothetical protein
MRLYVVTRRDLSTGTQAVQSCHVLWQFSCEHVDVGHSWFEGNNTLDICTVADELELACLLKKARAQKIRCATFNDAMHANALMAISFEETAKTRKLLGRLLLTR